MSASATTANPGGDSGRLPALELRGIVKRFGGLVANDHVDLDVARGEVHALLGENGAGKTTLMRIAYGLTRADEGRIVVEGRERTIRAPRDAIAAGIGMVTQHFSLVRPMTVAENVALGRSGAIRVDLRAAAREVEEAADRFGIGVRPHALVGELSVGEQQRVEILKALVRDCRILILDEPTAVLVPQEVAALLTTLRRLLAEGLSVVFISHKLGEVRAISDRVSVLRHGRRIGTVPGTTDERELAAMMVGRPTFGVARSRSAATTVAGPQPILEIADLVVPGPGGKPALDGLSLSVGAGEIVGIAGVSGNGQTELVEVLSGMRRAASGAVRVDGRELTNATPSTVTAAGVGRIPEDRHASLVPDLSVAYNLVLEHLPDFRRGLRLDEAAIRANAEALIERFAIKAGPDERVATLSGGNIQKVLLARVLSRDPRLIVVSQPTRGLDVGATDYVRAQLLERRAAGTAILLVSEDLDELLALADRVVVLYEGRIAGALGADEADPARLGLLMAGRSGAVA